KTFDPSAWLQEERTAKFKFELPKDQLLLKYLFEPTVNICGIYSGYIEHGGTKTVLPHEAYAKIDIRLVKAMTVEGTLRKLRDHLKKRGYDDLRIEVHGPYGPAKTDPESWIAKAAVEAVQANGKEPEVWPSSGGTMPAFAFDEYLKLPWVSTGLGHGSRAHAPNEYASIDGMRRFMAGEATLLYAAAKRAPKRRRLDRRHDHGPPRRPHVPQPHRESVRARLDEGLRSVPHERRVGPVWRAQRGDRPPDPRGAGRQDFGNPLHPRDVLVCREPRGRRRSDFRGFDPRHAPVVPGRGLVHRAVLLHSQQSCAVAGRDGQRTIERVHRT